MSSPALVLLFQVLSLLGSGLTVLKLWQTGLSGHYRVFFWYFLFRIPDGIWPLFLNVKSETYFRSWVLTTPLVWTFYLLIVRELCSLILARHKGMYTLGKWSMYLGVTVSVVLSVLSFLPRIPKATPQRSQIIGYVYAVDRGITFGLAIFLILTVFLLSIYAITLSRNVIVHTVLFTIFFLSNSLIMLLKTVFGLRLYTTIDTALMGVASVCVFGWFFLLTPKGEEVHQPNFPEMGPEQESRILYQLDSLNSTLLKISKK
jgi:hypothetical protein